MFTWKEAKPEKYGIPTEAVEKLEDLLAKMRLRIHGYMLIRGDCILAEKYYAPFHRESLHRMYSITKSFTALAVGLLVKNGLVKTEDKICSFFPEMLPQDGAHPWCEEMTIKDMLTMRTCHSSTTYKRYAGEDWTESFFRVKPDHVPGTVFSYDTSSSQVLAALVEKLTGKKMLDYMRAEMLDELGFSREAYIISDPVGVSQGGSGLMCTLRDVAIVAHLCSRLGTLRDREYLPRSYMQEAVSCQVPTDMQPLLDEQCGYGYFIWMPREEGFTFFGMGGQLAVCFPQYDFCYITMADTMGNPAGVQALHDCFYQSVFPYLQGCGAQGKAEKQIRRDTSGEEDSLRARTQGKRYIFYPNALKWDRVCFDWEKQKMAFAFAGGEFSFEFGSEAGLQPFLDSEYSCECCGGWKLGHFILNCYILGEDMGSVRMDFVWKDSRMSVRTVCAGDVISKEMKEHFQGFASAECAEMRISR
ncbi:MAG: beta-lactamase family protein [Blautia sp.]|nr:beta-lactamase family protein [Blautia sp.]